MDKGEYVESWREAAAYIRNCVTQQKWQQAVQGVREPLGKLISRKLKAAMYKKSLPGAPDGEYVVMQFDSSFAYKKFAGEVVTMVLHKDGKWQVPDA